MRRGCPILCHLLLPPQKKIPTKPHNLKNKHWEIQGEVGRSAGLGAGLGWRAGPEAAEAAPGERFSPGTNLIPSQELLQPPHNPPH